MADARVTPVGAFLEEGQGILVTLGGDPDISFWEREVTPMGVDGGDGIDLSTQHETAWAPMALRKLKRATPMTIVAAFDPVVYDQIIAQINVNQLVTITFSNNDTLEFYGGATKFEPTGQSEGNFPLANITIVPTLRHPTTKVTTVPNYITAAGTD